MDKCKAFYEALDQVPGGKWIKEFLDTWQAKDKDMLIKSIIQAVKIAEGGE